MVGLAQGGDDLALDVGAALCALGAVGAVVALRAEEVPLPARTGGSEIHNEDNLSSSSSLPEKRNVSPGEEAALRERGLAPVAAEARRVEVDVVGDPEHLWETRQS